MNALVPPPARFSSAEFQRLLKAGAFGDMRVELREGKIVKMSPQHLPHSRVRRLLAQALERALTASQPNLVVDEEVSIDFGGAFSPMADIVVWEGPAGGDAPQGPIPGAAVRLIVEVADTSLADDLGPKRADYAAAGLAEYWVADVAGRLLHRHAQPQDGAFAQEAQARFGEATESVTLGLTVATSALI